MQNIIEHVKQFMTQKSVSASDLARMIGSSTSVISQVLNQKYPGNTEEILKKLSGVTGYQNESDWPLLNTKNYTSIQNVCKDAQNQSRMLAIFGETGMGKTASLKKYQAENKNTYYIFAHILMTPTDFLKEIQRSLGSDYDGTNVNRAKDIIKRLQLKDKPLLIVDDIGKLKAHPKCYLLLQMIYDQTEGSCGLVLAGTKAFPNYIQKQSNRDYMGFRELKRRVSYWHELKSNVELSFVKTVATHFNITYPSAIDYIYRNCSNYGDVKELITNYNRYIELHGDVDTNQQQQVLAGLTFSQLSL